MQYPVIKYGRCFPCVPHTGGFTHGKKQRPSSPLYWFRVKWITLSFGFGFLHSKFVFKLLIPLTLFLRTPSAENIYGSYNHRGSTYYRRNTRTLMLWVMKVWTIWITWDPKSMVSPTCLWFSKYKKNQSQWLIWTSNSFVLFQRFIPNIVLVMWDTWYIRIVMYWIPKYLIM